VAFRAVAPLVDAAESGLVDRDETLRLLDDLRERVRPRSDLVDETYVLAARLTGDASRRKEFGRERVRAHLQAAEGLEGLARQVELTEAAQLAKTLGERDLEREAVVALQSLPEDDLGLVRLEATGAISRSELDDLVAQFVSGDWASSLARWAAYGSPIGSRADNEEHARQLDREFPLQALLPAVRLTEGGMPRAATTAERSIRQVETWNASYWSVVAAEVLDGIGRAFVLPARDDVAAVLGSDTVSASAAGRAASALHLYFTGEFEAAALLTFPAVERRLREIAIQHQVPVFTVQHGRKPGGFGGLGALLRGLREALDEDWLRYYEIVLTDGHGLNLRNDLVHGYADSATREQAALLLHVALSLFVQPPPAVRGAKTAEKP
jgi:hypothetical protein